MARDTVGEKKIKDRNNVMIDKQKPTIELTSLEKLLN